ncbi:MAG: CHASE domain-containing protein [Candidatus Nanopelagicales bacterium]|nr:CHASE domain-containing protein [Candidatus Nanopelagicales bacterium]MDD2819113.1 CHASE domain-containing protein [Candidatus Nanopelagicales bacterium]
MNLRARFRASALLRWIASILVLAVGLGITQTITHVQRTAQEERSAQVVQEFGDQFTDRVNNALLPSYYLTHSIESYVESVDGKLNKQEFSDLLDRIVSHSTNIRNIAVAPANRIAYVSPLTGNEAALGLYYPDIPAQWPAIQNIIASKLPRLIGPVDLVQGGRGLIYRYPVFKNDGSYWGLVSTVLDVDAFLEKQAAIPVHSQVDFALRTVNADGSPANTFWGNPDVFANPAASIFTLEPLDTRWELAVAGPALDTQPLILTEIFGIALFHRLSCVHAHSPVATTP